MWIYSALNFVWCIPPWRGRQKQWQDKGKAEERKTMMKHASTSTNNTKVDFFFSSLQFKYLQSLVIYKDFRGCKDKIFRGLFPGHQYPSYYAFLARHTQLFHKTSHCSFILKCWNYKSLLRHGKENLWKWGWKQAPYCCKAREHISPDMERKSAWNIHGP